MTPYFLRLLPCTAGVGGTENEEYMKKIRPYLWRGGALVLAAALVVLLVLSGMGLSTQEPEPLPQSPAQTIRTEGQGGASQQEKPNAPEQPEDPEDEDTPEEPETPEQPDEEPPQEEPDAPEQPENPTDNPEQPEQPGDNPQPGDHPGKGDNDGPGPVKPEPGPSDDTSTRIITDLSNCEITYNQLTDDTLPFYAYLINPNGETLKVKLQNSDTPMNGRYLTSADGKNYTAQLVRNETNHITLYRKKGNTTVEEVRFSIRYVAQKADEDHPTIGEHPPTIVTNLDGVTETSNRNFTLTVKATAYTGSPLYASQIEVQMDGKRITGPTGGPVYEYQLYFPDPIVGDTVEHTITIRAWDGEGNSAFVSYRILYRFVDTGDVIGTAYIVIDATTVGLDVMEEPYTYKIRQNIPASYAVIEALEEWGYEYEYSGSMDVGFYLRRISRGGMMDYPAIPENLWSKILQDGLTLTGQTDNNSLGEFDYTQGSGWMYSVGGNTYAGKGLSGYYLTDGDTLYLRFTLAYGKDIGGYSSTGGSYGLLPSYCGKWLNGTYIEEHVWGEPTQTVAPDCTHPGEISTVCTVCGDRKDQQEVPPLGHDFVETGRTEPGENGTPGYIEYTCSRCGEQKQEPIPAVNAGWLSRRRRLPDYAMTGARYER